MGNSGSKKCDISQKFHNHVTRERHHYFSQSSLANIASNLSGRSFASVVSHQSNCSVSRPWSRVSRRRWKESTLTHPYEVSKTAWPVANIEASFLPEFPLNADLTERSFRVIEQISRGAYGKVYKVEKIDTKQIYALKILSKSQIIEENAIRQVKEEVAIQKICGHNPFIVNCPFYWQSRRRLFIISEFVSGGELHQLLDEYGILPEKLVQIFAAEIVLVLDFLHNAGIIYRDLKPENILLDQDGHIRLIDFGLSKWLKYGDRTNTVCGTFRYMDRIFADRHIKMNARTLVFEMILEGRQMDEAILAMFHSVLFGRTYGKFIYSAESSYSVGTVGYMDVDCDFIDFTYVCCTSSSLDRTLRKQISDFSELLRANDSSGVGQISLEFFQKKRNRWPFQPECIPWEVWTMRLELINLNSEDERQEYREKVGDMLTEKIFYITEVLNSNDYVPKMPNQSELDLIFDTSYSDVQPYLFKFNYSTSGPQNTSVGTTMKKLFRETLVYKL